jgi:hypothetical protein
VTEEVGRGLLNAAKADNIGHVVEGLRISHAVYISKQLDRHSRRPRGNVLNHEAAMIFDGFWIGHEALILYRRRAVGDILRSRHAPVVHPHPQNPVANRHSARCKRHLVQRVVEDCCLICAR